MKSTEEMARELAGDITNTEEFIVGICPPKFDDTIDCHAVGKKSRYQYMCYDCWLEHATPAEIKEKWEQLRKEPQND